VRRYAIEGIAIQKITIELPSRIPAL